ncbi:MAG: ABC transporter substrate-binding protein [Armatimonadota bacterium]|nr:ABC transporter substrate-binding protein [Armatimonadota bacterium]MDR7448235.1 ABC transporter substrate-binding protein [Armatimonadota bacterium]MDR7458266.1 ABC transporter substrate-binding protein [Armatimonadota bacterium]MDR7478431.1 ABC transporter substrate-binding protein [Armatimonadota bacterium]MDR7487365.1 ABC transporter substrate-binding protein [Armatimonadota bacterium]
MRGRLHGVLLLCVVLAALASPPAQAQAPPRTLRIAVGIDADTLDPAGQTTTTVANMVDYIYETLVAYDYRENRVVPHLATRWQVSRDGLTYTFTLRSGVRFHDGTPLTAEAVKFTLERLLDPRTRVPTRFLIDAIEEVQTPTPQTVRLVLSKPSPTLLTNLTYTTTAIISPTAAQRIGAANLTRDATGAGTGPYMFKEWVRGTHILVTRNPNYWGPRPVFEEVMFRIVPDAGAREAMLLAGDVHMAMLPPAPDVRRLREHPNVTMVVAPTDRIIFVAMNTQWGPFKDARVRQAMNYAVNKKAILSSVLFDLGTVADSPCPGMMFGHHPVQPGGWPFNPIKAKQLLREAGVGNGFEVTFLTPTGRYIQDFQFAQAIAAQLRNVGIRANVATMDWPSYVAEITQPPERTRLQMLVLGWAWVVLDCDGVLFGQFHSSQHPNRGLAPAFYRNARVDALLEEARTIVDQERRKALYREAQTIIWNEAPWIFLWTQKWYVATVKNLRGVSITPIEKWDAIHATWQ